MAMDAKAVLQLIKDKNIQIVDTRFTDLFGGWQHYWLSLALRWLRSRRLRWAAM
jgi:glutamine synthetase